MWYIRDKIPLSKVAVQSFPSAFLKQSAPPNAPTYFLKSSFVVVFGKVKYYSY